MPQKSNRFSKHKYGLNITNSRPKMLTSTANNSMV